MDPPYRHRLISRPSAYRLTRGSLSSVRAMTISVGAEGFSATFPLTFQLASLLSRARSSAAVLTLLATLARVYSFLLRDSAVRRSPGAFGFAEMPHSRR